MEKMFEHKGGPIFDVDGNRRYWEDDAPGWYFWLEASGGQNYLFGPYESEEDAEFYLEAEDSR